eukprot:TRINITY_DN3627_c0_g1_i1.p1 TRINITY_DN3627_c0_g1~~TRINITY_DN3627_c0_g1_i1.p1  ORF type:complete len:901 (+),score=214.45 TRINITY_DN3627_c0_g1_i1:61-2763(+)
MLNDETSIEMPQVAQYQDMKRPLLQRGETIASLLGKPVPTYQHSGNKLGTFMGCYVPTMLNELGVVFFLRWGFIVGQYGVVLMLGMFLVSELCAFFTILSLNAVVTNGRVRGGGCYFMISRALGPEFGGAIGLVFWVANVVSGAQCAFGFGEAVTSIYLNHVTAIPKYWLQLIINSGALLVMMIVAMAGADWFTKAGLVMVIVLVGTVIFSFFVFLIAPPLPEAGFVGVHGGVFLSNLLPSINDTHSSSGDGLKDNTFVSVFGVLFPAVTGIMTGANLSGDLKDPAKSVPAGTLYASVTCGILNIIFIFLLAGTVERYALQNDYNIMAHIWVGAKIPWFIGILLSSLANALESVLGASRVLQALARDNLLPIGWLGKGSGPGDEPRRALFVSWLLLQACLFVPNLNILSTYSSMFLLQAWAFVNLACFVLSVTGTHNWRPTFKYFNSGTALLGSILCGGVMFLTNWESALISTGVAMLVFLYIHFVRKPQTSWGDVMQALMYHQVRKYLLRLDARKDHIKYWRPQLLLASNNPQSQVGLLQLCHGLKKGGLFVAGSVVINPDTKAAIYDSNQVMLSWQRIIKSANLKAFAEVVRGDTVRAGVQNLMLMAGLGNMRPNTLVLGWSDCSSHHGAAPKSLTRQATTLTGDVTSALRFFPSIPSLNDYQMSVAEYVGMMRDALYMSKSIILGRHFEKFILSSAVQATIDVWPLQRDGDSNATLSTALLLADGLRRTHGWHKQTRLRVLSAVDDASAVEEARAYLTNLLHRYRIVATAVVVVASESSLFCADDHDHSAMPHGYTAPSLPQLSDDEEVGETTAISLSATAPRLAKHGTADQAAVLNELIKIHSAEAACVFVGMNVPDESEGPAADASFLTYMRQVTQDLPATLMLQGVSTVITELQ